jgi:hypothetical protein
MVALRAFRVSVLHHHQTHERTGILISESLSPTLDPSPYKGRAGYLLRYGLRVMKICLTFSR